jgi:hypothetical protein
MTRAALALAGLLALASCDDFDQLLCARTRCDGGAGGGAGGGGGDLDAGVDAGADSGVDAGADAGPVDAGVPLQFSLVMVRTALSNDVTIDGLVTDGTFTLLATSAEPPLLTELSGLTTSVVSPFRPSALTWFGTHVFFAGDGGVDTWASSTGPGGRLELPSPLAVSALTGLPGDGVLALGSTPSGDLGWSALLPSDAGPVQTLPCAPAQLASSVFWPGYIHYVVGTGTGAACDGGVDQLFFARWQLGGPPLGLLPTPHAVVRDSPVRLASDQSGWAVASWQDPSGIRLAIVTPQGLDAGPGPVVPLSVETPALVSDLAVSNSLNYRFMLVLVLQRNSGALRFSDGGVHALERGVPLFVFGDWAEGEPVVRAVRVLRLGHPVNKLRVAHALSERMFVGGLCEGAVAGPFTAPCNQPDPTVFVIEVPTP